MPTRRVSNFQVQHLNFGATPSDYGTAGPYALSPMILKLSAEAQNAVAVRCLHCEMQNTMRREAKW